MESKQVEQVKSAIKQFALQYKTAFSDKIGHLPVVEADADWPSPCEQGQYKPGLNFWQPVDIDQTLSFSNVEKALSLDIHPSIKAYYTTIYSESMAAVCDEGHLELLFAWSEKDFERLQQNIIGHIMMKQKLKQDVNVFFAVTDKADIVLTVDNVNGEVWAEHVGKKPHKKVANSLQEFLCGLTPDIYVSEDRA